MYRALDLLRREPVEVVVVDVSMPGIASPSSSETLASTSGSL